MVRVIKRLKIKTMIHNGDLQENTFNERGITTEEDLASARSILDNAEQSFGVKIFLNAGNHETGYHKTAQPLATDPEGGASVGSIINFLKLTQREELYHSFVLGECRIIFIPYLLTESFGKNLDVENVKDKILGALLRDLHSSQKTIMFIHDPDSLMNKRLANLIRTYKPLVFCGHYHANFSLWVNKILIKIFCWKLLAPLRLITRLALNVIFDSEISLAVQKYYQKRRIVPALMKEFDVQIIPAPDGMLGFGGGFLVLDLETLEIERFS